MSRPRSVTAGAGLAGLTAALTALLWTATDFASTTATAPPPPSPPAGVSAQEWDRVLASTSPGPAEPMTNLGLFSLVFEGALIALALAGIVLWLVVALAAARGLGWARFVAIAVAAGQSVTLSVLATASPPGAYAIAGAVIVAGAASAVLLLRPEAIAHSSTPSGPTAAAVPAS